MVVSTQNRHCISYTGFYTWQYIIHCGKYIINATIKNSIGPTPKIVLVTTREHTDILKYVQVYTVQSDTSYYEHLCSFSSLTSHITMFVDSVSVHNTKIVSIELNVQYQSVGQYMYIHPCCLKFVAFTCVSTT